MSKQLHKFLSKELQNLEAAGLLQEGFSLTSAQSGRIQLGTKTLLNFASDNYLGWAFHEGIGNAAGEVLEKYGTSWASGRVVSGTHDLHRRLDKSVSQFLKTEDTLLFA